MTPDDTEDLMRSISSEDNIQQVRENVGADFAFAFGDAARFRVSVFKERGDFAMVLRQIPSTLLTMEQIGIPLQREGTALQTARSRLGHRADRFR